LGEYYSNRTFDGKPSFSRIDSMVNFDFGENGSKSDFPKYNFSVRWTGKIHAPKTGEYTLEVLSDDGIRVWLDGKLVIENWNDHGPEANSFRLLMEDQKEYQIRIDYYQHGGGAVAKLGWYSPQKDPISEAVQAAKQSDAALLFVGTAPNIETEGSDRETLILPRDQDRLIQEVLKVNRNTIVILNTGSPVLMDPWVGQVKGVVQAWFGGQEMSKGMVEVLSGVYNPSGKLPITFPHSWEDCSAYSSYKKKDSVTEYTDGIYVGYRHFEKKKISPLFPFGFGLSYTSFQYSDLNTTVEQQGNQLQVEVSLSITNEGKREGAEVVQVYVRDVAPDVDRPVKELKAFKKVMLQAGETQVVRMLLKKDAFTYYDDGKKAWTLRPGTYALHVGGSSNDIRLTKMVEVQ